MNTDGGLAVVFPGQGAQRKGMGADFYNGLPASRAVYEEASDILGWDVADMCFEENDLVDLTEYTQPCIFTTEIAMLRGLQAVYGLPAKYFGGHSVGEYAALVAAGAMPFSEALHAVRHRGRLMQNAFSTSAGGMTAVIGENIEADLISSAISHLPVDVANINSIGQVVISGRFDALDDAQHVITQAPGIPQSLRFVRLNVSAPFHSRFMAGIGKEFRTILEEFQGSISPARAVRVTSNYTGDFHPDDRLAVIDNLVFQISGAVQWRKNMDRLSEKAAAIFEIGPHRPLKSFFASINVECKSITTLASAERLLKPIQSAGQRKEGRHVYV